VVLPARLPRLLPAAALALIAALAVAGCTSSPAPATASPAASGATGATSAAPALTTAQARQAFDSYVATTARASQTGNGSLALSVVTGPERSTLTATLKTDSYDRGHGYSVTGEPGYETTPHLPPAVPLPYTYGTPTFYLPEAAGYPRFFVASAPRDYPGTDPGDPYATWVGSAEVPLNGTALLLFEQSAAGARWQLASASVLAPGTSVPRLAGDADGAVPTVPLTSGTFLAEPDIAGSLQAAVVDDGPSSAASKVVAAGPLTTGMHQGASDHVQGLGVPAGDVYQWELQGADYPAFTFRTASGAALVFYSMYLESYVATPGYINKANPLVPGPPISYTAALAPWIGTGPHRIYVQQQDLLTFAAVDPPAGGGKISVIAVGGGLNYAAAS
jgi:hypothetical protein